MDKMAGQNKTRPRGFTLVELLVVILIVAILMAVAMPLYLDAVTRSKRTACRSNMQTIATAEQAYRARNLPTHNFTSNLANLGLDPSVVCVDGGTYSVAVSTGTQTAQNGNVVPDGGLIITCSIPEHGIFAPSIDGE